MHDYSFKRAVPVWADGREKEMNVWLAFTTKVPCGKHTILSVTGSSAYNIRINGEFFAFGPARCAHGFYRVDELDLTFSSRKRKRNNDNRRRVQLQQLLSSRSAVVFLRRNYFGR